MRKKTWRGVSVFFYWYWFFGITYVFLRGLWESISQERHTLLLGSIVMGAVFSAVRPFWLRLNNRLKHEVTALEQVMYCNRCEAAGAPHVQDVSQERRIVGKSESGNPIVHCRCEGNHKWHSFYGENKMVDCNCSN